MADQWSLKLVYLQDCIPAPLFSASDMADQWSLKLQLGTHMGTEPTTAHQIWPISGH